MKRLWIPLLAIVLAGCAAEAAIYGPPYPVAVETSSGYVDIPAGHLPPPGSCRIWYPGRPEGQQPPPEPCGALIGHVPPGAVLVRG